MEIKEQREMTDPRKNKYVVRTCRDTSMIKTYIQFVNKVKHPRVSMNMFVTGVLLAILPVIAKGAIALPGEIIAYSVGALLMIMALFRSNISVWMTKNDPKVKVDEEIIYFFGNTGVRVEKDGEVENMGYYKTIYRVWEDEKNYYIGMNEEDLLILPMNNFEVGDAKEFRDFILEKSGADYRWKPSTPINIFKETLRQIQAHITDMRMQQEKKK